MSTFYPMTLEMHAARVLQEPLPLVRRGRGRMEGGARVWSRVVQGAGGVTKIESISTTEFPGVRLFRQEKMFNPAHGLRPTGGLNRLATIAFDQSLSNTPLSSPVSVQAAPPTGSPKSRSHSSARGRDYFKKGFSDHKQTMLE